MCLRSNIADDRFYHRGSACMKWSFFTLGNSNTPSGAKNIVSESVLLDYWIYLAEEVLSCHREISARHQRMLCYSLWAACQSNGLCPFNQLSVCPSLSLVNPKREVPTPPTLKNARVANCMNASFYHQIELFPSFLTIWFPTCPSLACQESSCSKKAAFYTKASFQA